MRKSVTAFLILLFLTSVVALPPATVKAQSKTIIVPDNHPTIQEALNAANEGDTIYIKKGYYEGSFNQTLEINKTITLYGEDKNATILNLSPPLVPMHVFTYEYMGYLASIQINSNNVKISGLTINTPGGDIIGKGDRIQILGVSAATGFSIEGKLAKISENTITGHVAVIGSNNTVTNNRFEIKTEGLNLEGITPTIGCVGSNNIIANNTLATENEKHNIKLNIEGSNNLIANNLLSTIHLKGSNNVIYKNSIKAVPGDSGVYLSHSSANTICANRITYAESITYQQEGVFLSESSDNVVYANNIESVFKGVYLQNTDTEPMVTNNNTFYHNNFINNQIQAWDYTSSTTNVFDNGKEGNYWNDYNGTDSNGDGIGDTPFIPTYVYTYDQTEKITKCNPDNCPLMIPFNIDSVTIDLPEWAITSLNPLPTPTVPEFPSWTILLLLTIATALGLLFHRKKHPEERIHE